ncbi:perlucin-like [Penaeus monodon]|uniref:perlucin-like n=1 Tax=Penaeus monodon TaxID=6687 RepID=UPI0018A73A64|nr:perlucin-like [Penaeus monodon]
MMTLVIQTVVMLVLSGGMARGDVQTDVENLRSAVVVNQLIMQQQSQVIQTLLNKFLDQESDCPYPYKMVMGECFYVSEVERVWEEARTFCQGMRGDLASPNSVYVLLAYVHDVSDEYAFWLGATDQQAEGVWQWLDGRPITDWGRGQPDNANGEEHCIHLGNKYVLNDNECTKLRRFVCEYVG